MEKNVDVVAAALVAARESGRPAVARDIEGALHSDAEAYAVQERVGQRLGWFGDFGPRYWKSGGASRASVLIHAALPASGVRTAGASLNDFSWHTPAVEAEVVLRLKTAVTPAEAQRLTHEEAPGLVDAMAVAIEIADSRWQEGLDAPALLRLADQGSHGALLIGEWRPYAAHDWSQQRCEVFFGAQSVIANTGAHSLGDPAWLLPIWLRHATRHGQAVAAGTVVTTGSWVGAIAMPATTDVLVRFAGLGEIGLRAGMVHTSRA